MTEKEILDYLVNKDIDEIYVFGKPKYCIPINNFEDPELSRNKFQDGDLEIHFDFEENGFFLDVCHYFIFDYETILYSQKILYDSCTIKLLEEKIEKARLLIIELNRFYDKARKEF